MPRKKPTPPPTNSKKIAKTNDTVVQGSTDAPNENKENSTTTNAKLPKKRNGVQMNVMGSPRKKKGNKSNNSTHTTLRVEGYGFEDDIIGVSHVRSDGEDAFNMTLRNMVVQDDLREKGFSAYVTLRDKLSGKDDDHLRGADGFPRYLFMSINMHKFENTTDAAEAVIEQCEKLHNVRNLVRILPTDSSLYTHEHFVCFFPLPPDCK